MSRRAGLSRVTVRGLLYPPRRPEETGIVHLGLGNFHRAHQAVYTAQALCREPGPWGVLGVAQRSREVVAGLRAQDHLYTVLELMPGSARVAVPGVLTGTLVAAGEPGAVTAAIAAPATRIVSLTVTEKGYRYSAATLGLDRDSPDVRADLAGAAGPVTVIGQLARGLQRRLRAHGAPVAVLSCDNLAGNGPHTRRLVTEFIEAMPPAERDELLPWVAAAVTFPATMVDRIVPATTDEHRAMVTGRTGLRDRVPVPAEPFSMWVMEDLFPAGRPAWEAAGAIFTGDVGGFEVLKLRLLNGTHSLIAYLGLLAGCRHIAGALRVPAIEQAARAVLTGEYLPTLRVPEGVDIGRYTAELFARFGNTATRHLSSTVGSDGSLKLPVRITGPVYFHARQRRVPRFIALTVAAYLRCLAVPGSYDTAALGEISDPAAGRLAALGARHPAPAGLARAVFAEPGLFAPGLAEHGEFVAAVAELFGVLNRRGVAAAVAAAGSG